MHTYLNPFVWLSRCWWCSMMRIKLMINGWQIYTHIFCIFMVFGLGRRITNKLVLKELIGSYAFWFEWCGDGVVGGNSCQTHIYICIYIYLFIIITTLCWILIRNNKVKVKLWNWMRYLFKFDYFKLVGFIYSWKVETSIFSQVFLGQGNYLDGIDW